MAGKPWEDYQQSPAQTESAPWLDYAAPAATTPPQDYQRKPSIGERVRSVAYPVAEAVGAGLGGLVGTGVGPAGTVAGASLGYAGVKGLENIIDQYTGAAQPETLGQAAARTARDVATGATYEMGGQLLGRGLSAAAGAFSKGAKAPSVKQLEAQSNELRSQMYKTNQEFDPNALKNVVQQRISEVTPQFPIGSAVTEIAPKTQTAIKQVDDLIKAKQKGTPIKIDQLEHLNSMLNDAVLSGGRDSVYASKAKQALNEFADSVGGETAELWNKARALETQRYRSQDVQNIVKAAEESSSATSSEIRSRFGDIAGDKNQMKLYTPEQQGIIKQIADGTATQKTFELIGKMAPKGFTWQKIAGLLGVSGFGGAPGAGAALAAYGTGAAARGAANMLATRQVNMLDELIRGGKLPQQIQLPQTTQRLFPAGVNVLANQLQGQQ